MFSKFNVLSLFVFCLVNLGQAAPIIDEVSSLSTREFPSLVTRGFFQHLFGHKVDAETKKQIDAVSITAECHLYNIVLESQKAYNGTQHLLTLEMEKATKEKKPVMEEYKKRVKKFSKLTKDAGKEVKEHKAALKKLGVEDAATHCESHATSSHSTSLSSSHSTHHSVSES